MSFPRARYFQSKNKWKPKTIIVPEIEQLKPGVKSINDTHHIPVNFVDETGVTAKFITDAINEKLMRDFNTASV